MLLIRSGARRDRSVRRDPSPFVGEASSGCGERPGHRAGWLRRAAPRPGAGRVEVMLRVLLRVWLGRLSRELRVDKQVGQGVNQEHLTMQAKDLELHQMLEQRGVAYPRHGAALRNMVPMIRTM